ncbi:MAG: hypothetical protein U0235_10080 [Polyangiaceae bacterium]
MDVVTPPVATTARPRSSGNEAPAFTPSKCIKTSVFARAQWPVVQSPVAQSVFSLHDASTSHFFAQPPPQSTSPSPPFFTPSSHAGATHFLVTQLETRSRSTGARRAGRARGARAAAVDIGLVAVQLAVGARARDAQAVRAHA